ncbi:MAG: hypothetical protein Q4D58_09885 [Synergistaceae bacterium]|nr:hypothetical protein [Synergistaceae bacterium]
MTYLEHLMSEIKRNPERLTKEQKKKLCPSLSKMIIENFCPGEFFDGAEQAVDGACEQHRSCRKCWKQEAEQ